MNVASTKQYKTLARHYLSKPDVQTWCVLADLCEEAGETALAAQWRRRAAWFGELFDLYHVVSVGIHYTIREASWGLWRVTFSNRDKPEMSFPYVEVIVERREPGDFATAFRCFRIAHRSVRGVYRTERILGIIDWCSEVEAKTR